MYERVLAGYERRHQPDHTSTLYPAHNLGTLYSAEGKLTEAETMFKRALTGCLKTLGPDHPSTLATANALAKLYLDQGRIAEAASVLPRAPAGSEDMPSKQPVDSGKSTPAGSSEPPGEVVT